MSSISRDSVLLTTFFIGFFYCQKPDKKVMGSLSTGLLSCFYYIKKPSEKTIFLLPGLNLSKDKIYACPPYTKDDLSPIALVKGEVVDDVRTRILV